MKLKNLIAVTLYAGTRMEQMGGFSVYKKGVQRQVSLALL